MSALPVPASRRNAGRFAPGQSGNPAGRKAPGASLAAYVQKQSKGGKEVIDFLLAVLRNDTQELAGVAGAALPRGVSLMWRMEAASMLLDRGFGKPTQPTEISGPNQGPIELSDVDLERKFLQDLARIAALTGAAEVLPSAEPAAEGGPGLAVVGVDGA